MLSPSPDFRRGTNFIRSAGELITNGGKGTAFSPRFGNCAAVCAVVGISVVSSGTANINWAELI